MPQPPARIDQYRAVQSIAKSVLADIAEQINPSSTERTLAAQAVQVLADRGIHETWYYACPALVLLGSRSCASISGRSYLPSDEPVGQFNLVTIDLSPLRNSTWGDCARSFYVENGRVHSDPEASEFTEGKRVLSVLHAEMQQFVTPATSFHDLYEFANAKIEQAGYENLDALGNLGHSITTSLDAREYIEQSNRLLLGNVPFFTFEPHIRARNGRWGFKHEDIYYFDPAGQLQKL